MIYYPHINKRHEVNNDNKLISYELRRKVQVQLEVQDVLRLKTDRYSDVCTNYRELSEKIISFAQLQ